MEALRPKVVELERLRAALGEYFPGLSRALTERRALKGPKRDEVLVRRQYHDASGNLRWDQTTERLVGLNILNERITEPGLETLLQEVRQVEAMVAKLGDEDLREADAIRTTQWRRTRNEIDRLAADVEDALRFFGTAEFARRLVLGSGSIPARRHSRRRYAARDSAASRSRLPPGCRCGKGIDSHVDASAESSPALRDPAPDRREAVGNMCAAAPRWRAMNLRTLQAMAVRDVVRGSKLVEAVERVSQDGARLVLTRYGMPVAAVVSLGDLERLAAVDDGTRRSRNRNSNSASSEGRKVNTR